MFFGIIFPAILLVSAPGASGAVVPGVKVETISPDEGRYYHGWPTVTRLSNGHLMAVWSGGRDAHVCPFGRVESMISRDNGQSWSWPRVIYDSPIDDRDAGVLETARGTLLVSTFGSVGYRNPDRRERYAQQPEKWDRYENGHNETALRIASGPKLLRSEDGGITWSAVPNVPVNSPHGPIQLKDGRLLFPGVSSVGTGRGHRPGERKVGVWESTDDGKTWTLRAEIPARPGENTTDYHELHGVEAANGTLIVMIRSHANPDTREMLQTVSRDGGSTWSVPRSLGLRGYPAHLARLNDGRLLLSYDSRVAPYGVHVRFSRDHGATWQEPLEISANAEKLDQGYPSTVQVPDGSFVTIWYEASKGNKAVLKQARWTEPRSISSTR